MRRLSYALLVSLAIGCSSPAPVGAMLDGSCQAEDNPACDTQQSRMLICRNGHYDIYADCKGPGGCFITDGGDSVSCDHSGNSIGDRCPPTSEGKVRCDPDGGLDILRCIDGGLSLIYVCPVPLVCLIDPDAGLTCR